MIQMTIYNGTHPCGRTAKIEQYPNGFCDWSISDVTGEKIYAGQSCESLEAAKSKIREYTYVMTTLSSMRTSMNGKRGRWSWSEPETKIPDSITQKLSQTGMATHLRCIVCGRTQDYSLLDMAEYLAHGWPVCCDQTMHLVKKGESK